MGKMTSPCTEPGEGTTSKRGRRGTYAASQNSRRQRGRRKEGDTDLRQKESDKWMGGIFFIKEGGERGRRPTALWKQKLLKGKLQ